MEAAKKLYYYFSDSAQKYGFVVKGEISDDQFVMTRSRFSIEFQMLSNGFSVTVHTPNERNQWLYDAVSEEHYWFHNLDYDYDVNPKRNLATFTEQFNDWLAQTFTFGTALGQTPLKAVVINVPESLLQIDPPILRKDQFQKNFKKSNLRKLAYPVFLDNVCTPKQIVNDEALIEIAKRHDTFYPPPLLKLLMQKNASLTPEEKEQAKIIAESEVLRHWDYLISTLEALNFSCRDEEQVRKYDTEKLSGQLLFLLLDVARTKLTRTACTVSHSRAYQAMIPYSDLFFSEVALLLEDDVVFCPGIDQQIRDILIWLAEHDPQWSCVQLGWSKHPGDEIILIDNSPLSRSAKGVVGNTCILVNLINETPSKIVSLIRRKQLCTPVVPNDVILAEANDEHWYLATKRLVGPPIGVHNSVLIGKEMDYTNVCWDQEQIANLLS